MKLIKLTDKNGQTYGNTQWAEGVTHTVEWSGQFCGPGCIHVYKDIYVALMLNPIHANFSTPRAWNATGKMLADDNGLKFGVASLTILSEIKPLPAITTVQRVAFGIYCAMQLKQPHRWIAWANRWLSGKDRTAAAAAANADTANAAANAAYAAYAAYAAANAAYAAYAAAYAAYAADDAANAAYAADANIDLRELAHKAMEMKP